MLDKLRQDLANIQAKHPILAWSGGKDSQLLLFLLREIYGEFPVLVFPHWWDNKDFVAKMVKEWDLVAYTYRPNHIYASPDHVISYYQVGKNLLPVITDVLNFDKCGLDRLNISGRVPHFEWDLVITGSKSCDSHKLVPKLQFPDDIYTPLWDWTDGEVHNAIDELGVPVDTRIYIGGQEKYDTGNWSGCLACQTTGKAWCFKANKEINGVI